MTRHGSLSHMASSNQLRPLRWLAPCRMAIASSQTSAHQNASKSSAVRPASSVIDPISPINALQAAHSLAAPEHKTP
jgi:hypothetical protein